MFYTKYRPQKFTEISSPNQVAEALMTQVKSGKVEHAYLFVGSRGTGKTTTARILAKAVNCLAVKKNGDPCNECAVCKAVQVGSFLDLIEIDAASNRGIDDIRELKDRIKLAPSFGKKKVYIIDEVHMLTTEAFNALLKTLEEPPKHTMFILCTTEIHKVPDTIKSRCQVFKFKRATITQLVEKLDEITKKEGAQLSKDELKKVAQAAFGGFRDAETLLQQVIEGNVDVNSLSGISSRESLADFVDALLENNAAYAIKQVNKVVDEGIDLYVWTGELLKYLRDLVLIKSNAHTELVDLTEETFSTMEKQAKALDGSVLVNQIEQFIKAQNLLKTSFIPQLPLELAIVALCQGEPTSQPKPKSPEPVKPKPKEKEAELKMEKKVIKIDFSKIEQNWSDVLTKLLAINNSILALLKSGKAVDIDGNIIILEVFYAFHKERLEHPKNRKVIESVLSEVFGEKLSIKCRISEHRPKKLSPKETGELTDYNITLPSASTVGTTAGNVLDIFDGGLPLK